LCQIEEQFSGVVGELVSVGEHTGQQRGVLGEDCVVQGVDVDLLNVVEVHPGFEDL